jgi:quercetin dioxygenase-like cupin family protein
MEQKDKFYPEIITSLPSADIPFSGIRGNLLQGNDQQLVFMTIEPVGKLPPHSHGAQWGVVLDGEMELTIGDETKRYLKGDSYYIPDGVVHSANFLSKVRAVDFFDDKERYKPKK